MVLRTSVVGSWWPQEGLEERLFAMHRTEMAPGEAESLLIACASRAISQQKALGLTEWTGGEYFSDEFLNHMQKVLRGIEITKPSRPQIFDYDDFAEAKIDGFISAPNGMGYLAAYRREEKLAGGVCKATIVGPLELAFNVMSQYGELMNQLPRLIAIVNAEIRGLEAEGCPVIQLDVPTFATLITMNLLTIDQTADIITKCFAGVKRARRGIHICSGNLTGRPLSGDLSAAPWAQILERLDGVIDFAHLAVHYFHRYMERSVFAAIPKSIDLQAGVVDEASYGIEPVWKIRERAADWARVVGEERLWLAPSCGFGRHPLRDVPVLKAKMENMVEAAAMF